MKSSVSAIVIVACGVFAWAQSQPATPPASQSSQTQPGSSSAQSTSSGGLRVRGPEAVAQQDPNKVVATIDGHPITAQQAVNMLKQIPEEQRRNIPSLSDLLQRVYTVDQLSDEAEKKKLDQESPWREDLQLNRKQILTQAYLADLTKSSSAQASTQAQQYYDSHAGDFEQVKLSGILVAFNAPGTPASAGGVNRTETDAQQKANDLEKKIKAGGDFSALARTDSDHQQSSTQGGTLGTYPASDPRLPPEIRTAIAKLQGGQVSEPIRVNGGYFIIKVDSRTKVPFDQVRSNIIQKQELDKYKIQVQDPDFFSSSAPGPNIPSLQRPSSTTTPAHQQPPASKPSGQ